MVFMYPTPLLLFFVRCVAHLNVQNDVLHCAVGFIIALPVVWYKPISKNITALLPGSMFTAEPH